jgi:hypothetical protein
MHMDAVQQREDWLVDPRISTFRRLWDLLNVHLWIRKFLEKRFRIDSGGKKGRPDLASRFFLLYCSHFGVI